MKCIRIKVFRFDSRAQMEILFDHKLELAASIQFDYEGTIKTLRSLFPNSIGVEFNVM